MDRDVELINTLSPQRSNNVAKATRQIVEFLDKTHATLGKTVKTVKFNVKIITFLEEHIFKYKAKEETRWNGIFNKAQVSDIIDTLMKYDFLSKLNPQSFVAVGRIFLLSEGCLALEQGLFRMMDTLRSKPDGRKEDSNSAVAFKSHVGKAFLLVLAEYLTLPKPSRLKRWALYLLDELCVGCGTNIDKLVHDKIGRTSLISLAANTTGPQSGHDGVAQVSLLSLWTMIGQRCRKDESFETFSKIIWDGFEKNQLQVFKSLQATGSKEIKTFTDAWFNRVVQWLYDTGCCQESENSPTSIVWLPEVVSLNGEFFFPENAAFILSMTAEYISLYAFDIESQNARFLDIPYDNVISFDRKTNQESPFIEIQLEIEDFIEGFTYLDNLDEDDSRAILTMFIKPVEANSVERKIKAVCKNSNTPPRSSMPGGIQYVYMHNATTETQLQRRRDEVSKDVGSTPPRHEEFAAVQNLVKDVVPTSHTSSDDQLPDNDETSDRVRNHGKSGSSEFDKQLIGDDAGRSLDLDIPDIMSSIVRKPKGKLTDGMTDKMNNPLTKSIEQVAGKRSKIQDRQQEVSVKNASSTKVRDEFDFECTDDEDDYEATRVKTKGKSKNSVSKKSVDSKQTTSVPENVMAYRIKPTNSDDIKEKDKRSKTISGSKPGGDGKEPRKRASRASKNKSAEFDFYKPPEDRVKPTYKATRRPKRRTAAEEASKRISDVAELERQDTQLAIPDQITNGDVAYTKIQLFDRHDAKSKKTLSETQKRGHPTKQIPLSTYERDLSPSLESNFRGSFELEGITLESTPTSHEAESTRDNMQRDASLSKAHITENLKEFDKQEMGSQNNHIKTKYTSHRRYGITESGSPVSSQHHDQRVEEKMAFRESNSPSLSISTGFEIRESNHLDTGLERDQGDQPKSVKDDKGQKDASAYSNIQLFKHNIGRYKAYDDGLMQNNLSQLAGPEKGKVLDTILPKESVPHQNIVVEQVAGTSPQSILHIDIARPANNKFNKRLIQPCHARVQEDLATDKQEISALVQHSLPNFVSVKANVDGITSKASFVESNAVKSGLMKGIRQRKSRDDGLRDAKILSIQKVDRTKEDTFKCEKVAQTKEPASQMIHEPEGLMDMHDVAPLSTSRLWEIADDDPDKTLIPILNNDSSDAGEEYLSEAESLVTAKVKNTEASDDSRAALKSSKFNADVPATIGETMIRIMDYHTQLLMKPQERALSILDGYQAKGEEMCKDLLSHHEKEVVQSQYEVRNLANKYQAAIKKGHDDVLSIEVKVLGDDVEGHVREQDAQMDKMMQDAIKRYGTA